MQSTGCANGWEVWYERRGGVRGDPKAFSLSHQKRVLILTDAENSWRDAGLGVKMRDFLDVSGLRRLMERQLAVPVHRFVWVVGYIYRFHLAM